MTQPLRRYPNSNPLGRNFKTSASYSGDVRSPAIAERGLIAFPSNTRLSARARGMGRRDGTTALGSPRDAGIDGGEGQHQRETLRAPWKGRAGEVEEAFGFSLALLLARSA